MSYASEVLADSPLLYVRFEETAGSTCANDGSLGGNATAIGTFTRNIATGLSGLNIGIDFDGTSGGATYPDTAALDLVGDMTYECWFNADALQVAMLMSKGQDGGGNTGYQLLMVSDGSLRVFIAGSTILTSGGSQYAAGNWYHLAATRSSNTYTIYINGSSVASGSSGATVTATAEKFGIGHQEQTGSATTFFNGKMDEVAVYNTPLSGARIAAHYAARNTGPAAQSVPQTIVIS